MKLLWNIKIRIGKYGIKSVQYSIIMLSKIIINKKQESYINLFLIPFGQLLDISFKRFIFLKSFDTEFSYLKVGFTDEISKSLEMEDKINITLVVTESLTYKKWLIY